MRPVDAVPPDQQYLASLALPTTQIQLRLFPPGKTVDWHIAPVQTLVLFCDGAYECETSDGDIRRMEPPVLVLAADTRGKGHKSRLLSDRPTLAVFIPLPDGLPG
jgi:hypothetical protein